MRRIPIGLVLAGLALSLAPRASSGDDPLQLFAPWIVVSEAEKRRLDADAVVVWNLRAGDGQVAVFAVTRLNAPPDALVAWTRSIEELKRGSFVLGAGRFHDPPQLPDLETLYLDERELDSLRGCALNDCVLRLTAGEIESLRTVVTASGEMWRDAAEREFRRLLLERLTLYRQGGLASLPLTAHDDSPVSFAGSFAAVMQESPYLVRVPYALEWLRDGRVSDQGDVESFLYWSNEDFGAGKPVISVTHVAIFRNDGRAAFPPVLVAIEASVLDTLRERRSRTHRRARRRARRHALFGVPESIRNQSVERRRPIQGLQALNRRGAHRARDAEAGTRPADAARKRFSA